MWDNRQMVPIRSASPPIARDGLTPIVSRTIAPSAT
jgi:hypothetical protein